MTIQPALTHSALFHRLSVLDAILELLHQAMLEALLSVWKALDHFPAQDLFRLLRLFFDDCVLLLCILSLHQFAFADMFRSPTEPKNHK